MRQPLLLSPPLLLPLRHCRWLNLFALQAVALNSIKCAYTPLPLPLSPPLWLPHLPPSVCQFRVFKLVFCCPFSCPPPLALLTHISACRRVLISMARTRRPRSAGHALPYPPPRLALVIPSIHPVFGQLCACARIHNEREFVFTLRIRRIALTPVSLSISLPLFLPPSRSLACCMPGTSLVNNSC